MSQGALRHIIIKLILQTVMYLIRYFQGVTRIGTQQHDCLVSTHVW